MKKKIRKHKGFSLIEILATIVILGIVSTVGIVSVNRMITNSRQHYYESQEQQMVLAAQSYVNDNRNILPKNVGGMRKIYLSTLREKNYLKEDIVDQNKEVCYKDKSYVAVYKSSKSEYKYNGYLECPACKQNGGDSCYSADQKTKPVIDITLTQLNGNQGDRLFQDSSNITINLKSISEPTANSNIKIASYSYKIYVNNELKYDSGTRMDNKRNEHTITEELYKYVPGKVKVVVTLTNTEGSTTSKTATNDYYDLQLPSCGKVSYEGAHPLQAYDSQSNNKPVCGSSGNAWINGGSRNVWIVCNDTKELGCSQHEFSQVFTTEGVTDNIIIKDRSGKERVCPINKCIDLTTTDITINVYKRKSDGTKDGGVKQTVTVGKEQSANASVNKEYSGWVNGVDYPHGVIIEVVLKDSLSNVKSLTWKENKSKQKETETLTADQTVTPTSSDTLGTSKTYTATHAITTEGVRKEVITVEDTPGNKMTVNYKIRIDLTKPTCDITKTHLNTTDGVTTTTTCTDNPDISGIKTCEEQHKKVKDDVEYDVKDVAGNPNTCKKDIYKQRQKATCNTCDNGSCSGSCARYNTYCCQYVYEYCSTGGGICGGGRTCNSDDGHDCTPPGAFDIQCNKTCEGSCASWNSNCAKCGCASWNNWENVSSCSESSSKTSKVKCQTLYY